MTAADNVTMLLSLCSSLLYAMRVLRAHGIPATSLHDIFRATVVSRIQYAAPAWSGMCSSADRGRLDSIVRRSQCLGYSNITRLSLSCLALPTMISSTASRLTPVKYYSHICLTNSIYLTNFEPAHTTMKQNCSIVQISSYVCCTNTPVKYVIRATLRA